MIPKLRQRPMASFMHVAMRRGTRPKGALYGSGLQKYEMRLTVRHSKIFNHSPVTVAREKVAEVGRHRYYRRGLVGKSRELSIKKKNCCII